MWSWLNSLHWLHHGVLVKASTQRARGGCGGRGNKGNTPTTFVYFHHNHLRSSPAALPRPSWKNLRTGWSNWKMGVRCCSFQSSLYFGSNPHPSILITTRIIIFLNKESLQTFICYCWEVGGGKSANDLRIGWMPRSWNCPDLWSMTSPWSSLSWRYMWMFPKMVVPPNHPF